MDLNFHTNNFDQQKGENCIIIYGVYQFIVKKLKDINFLVYLSVLS